MKKILSLIITFITMSAISVYASDMRFVQVTDLMFSVKDENSVNNFKNLITDINKQKNVNFVVFTGNNIAKLDKNNLEGFLDNAKKLNSPYYVILGNKDVNKQKNLSKAEYMKIVQKENRSHKKIEFSNYVFEKNGVVFIAVDGSKEVIPSTIGYYKADTLKWLDETLNLYKNKNVIILQHFPIVPPAKKENRYTFKADEYLKLLNHHKNVKAVVAGHFDVNNEQNVNGILHISTENAPSYRIIDIMDYDTQNPTFWSTCR